MYCDLCGQPSAARICPECDDDWEDEYGMTLEELQRRDADMRDYFADLEVSRQIEER